VSLRVNVFLMCVGAVMALATDGPLAGVSLAVVGVILVGCGAIGLLLALLVWEPRQLATPARSPAEPTPAPPATATLRPAAGQART